MNIFPENVIRLQNIRFLGFSEVPLRALKLLKLQRQQEFWCFEHLRFDGSFLQQIVQ